jgi:hypothetical protein
MRKTERRTRWLPERRRERERERERRRGPSKAIMQRAVTAKLQGFAFSDRIDRD